jgi:1-deoxy-D-xylulose-5-phosphate reductoisomerase
MGGFKMVKKIVILGSTGSVGRQTLQVVDELADQFEVIGLAAGANLPLLTTQIEKYRPKYVSIASAADVPLLKDFLRSKTESNTEIFSGINGLVNLAELPEIDLLLVAVSGINGLLPTLTALKNKTTVALANKETIVTAGSLVMQKAKEAGVRIIPVDSEHSAVFQCFEEKNQTAVDKLILTASGGPFVNYTKEELLKVTPEKALNHPNWKMGAKITVDCAGLINKGLEVIEAHWLFGVPYEKIEVVVHPQSIIHSMVQYEDGVVLAQMGCTDMRVPIQYALTYPKRVANTFPKIDFAKLREISFSEPDYLKFPGLSLAFTAGQIGGTMTTVFNGANEEAVQLFLKGRIRFVDIPHIIEKVMAQHNVLENFMLSDILEIDQWSRLKVQEVLPTL